MNKIYLLICIIPLILIGSIFILIQKKHSENPDILSCTSFQVALKKTVRLYINKQSFDDGVRNICNCFIKNNPHGGKMGFVTRENLDKCAKPIIYNWLIPFEKQSDNLDPRERCFKDNVYEKIIVVNILKELEITHQSGFFRNDLFEYQKNTSGQVSLIHKSCYQ